MNVSPPAPQPAPISESASPEMIPVPAAEIDRSCRWPVTLLLVLSVTWLALGVLLGVISSIKLHGPGFLASWSWLTYGRVRPAFMNALVFGFASQAGLAVGLWLLARLGRTVLLGPVYIMVAALFWNLGVLIGVAGILAGDATGYELLEFPRYATPILFCAYALIGVWALLTFQARREGGLYPSQWYVLAALLWFPWVYSTAQLLLVFSTPRGALQAVVGGWAAHNLFSLWLTPLMLAASFYFLPKLASRPLHSRGLAVFGFWLLAVFGAFGGLPVGTPVPKWLTGISTVGTVMSLLAVLAVAANWFNTVAGVAERVKSDVTFRFVAWGAISYVLASVLQIAGALREVSQVTAFTLYTPGVTQLYLYGFVGLTVSGAIHYIVPRLTDAPWPSPRLVKFHFSASIFGTALISLPLIVGGVIQGQRLNNPGVSFLEVVAGTKPFLGVSTLGGLLLFAGTVALLINLVKLACTDCCGGCCAWLTGSDSKSIRRRP